MKESTAIRIVIVIHTVLTIWKIFYWILSWSVAVISDWIHSWIDVITAIVIWIATKVSKLPSSDIYQFWHSRAQPIWAFFVAVMAWVAWIEIIKYWFDKLFNPIEIKNIWTTVILMILMTCLSWFISYIMTSIWRKNNNSVMIASWKETIWDMFITFWTAIWLIIVHYSSIYWIDPLIAIIIGLVVIKIAYWIAMESIISLMWAKANPEYIDTINKTIFNKFPIVIAIHDIRTQQLWNKIYAVIHCEIKNENLSFKQTHDIEESIQNEILKLDFIENTTIHLDFKNDAIWERILR